MGPCWRIAAGESAWAQYTDALRKISLGRSGSRSSRSGSLSRSCSSVVEPARRPVFRSALADSAPERLTGGAQLLGDGLHRDPRRWVLRDPLPNHATARSRTSAEYRLGRPKGPSQGMGPPTNSIRFNRSLALAIGDRVVGRLAGRGRRSGVLGRVGDQPGVAARNRRRRRGRACGAGGVRVATSQDRDAESVGHEPRECGTRRRGVGLPPVPVLCSRFALTCSGYGAGDLPGRTA